MPFLYCAQGSVRGAVPSSSVSNVPTPGRPSLYPQSCLPGDDLILSATPCVTEVASQIGISGQDPIWAWLAAMSRLGVRILAATMSRVDMEYIRFPGPGFSFIHRDHISRVGAVE